MTSKKHIERVRSRNSLNGRLLLFFCPTQDGREKTLKYIHCLGFQMKMHMGTGIGFQCPKCSVAFCCWNPISNQLLVHHARSISCGFSISQTMIAPNQLGDGLPTVPEDRLCPGQKLPGHRQPDHQELRWQLPPVVKDSDRPLRPMSTKRLEKPNPATLQMLETPVQAAIFTYFFCSCNSRCHRQQSR